MMVYKLMPNSVIAHDDLSSLTFQTKHALQSGAAVIQAAVIALFKSEPSLQNYANLFLEITETERQQPTPIFLTKLINKIYFEESDLQLKQNLLQRLSLLEANWQKYKRYVTTELSKPELKDPISLTKQLTDELVELILEQKISSNRHELFDCRQQALRLLGRNVIYTEYNQGQKRFFHRLTPIQHLTARQFSRLKTKYNYLRLLPSAKQYELLSRGGSCFEKGYGLANLWQETRGEKMAESEVVHTQTIHHASFWAKDFRKPVGRRKATYENLYQWLELVGRQYLASHPELVTRNRDVIPIPVSTCSLFSPLFPLANFFDSSQQSKQIKEIMPLIALFNSRHMVLTLPQGDDTLTLKCQFRINFQVYGTNLARALTAKDIEVLNQRNLAARNSNQTQRHRSVNPDYLVSFFDRVNQRLSLSEQEMQAILNQSNKLFISRLKAAKLKPKQELYYLYLMFRKLHHVYQASAEQNFHIQALWACINDKLRIPYDIWCNESRDRTTRTKMKHEAYLQFRSLYGHFPCVFSKTDRQKLKELEIVIHQNSAYTQLTSVNTPGVVGPRIYRQNPRVYKSLLNTLTRFKENLDDGNEHLHQTEDSMATSKQLSKSWKSEPIRLKNFFRHPIVFWSAVWRKLTNDPAPLLNKIKVPVGNLITGSSCLNLAYQVDLRKTPAELKQLLGYAENDSQVELSYAMVDKLRNLKLIEGVKNGQFVLSNLTSQRICSELRTKKTLIEIYAKLKAHAKLLPNEAIFLKERVLHNSSQTYYEALFDLDNRHAGLFRQLLFAGQQHLAYSNRVASNHSVIQVRPLEPTLVSPD